MLGCEYCNVVISCKGYIIHSRNCLKCPSNSTNEYVIECLYYNVSIKRERKVMFVKVWFDADILFVHQLVEDDGNYFTYDEFRTHFPVIWNTSILLSGGIINAIKEYQKQNVDWNCCITQECWNQTFRLLSAKNRSVQYAMSCSCDMPAAVRKWSGMYVQLHWKGISDHVF